MRRALVFALLIGLVAPISAQKRVVGGLLGVGGRASAAAAGGIAFVQDDFTTTASGTSHQLAYGSNVTAGSCLIAVGTFSSTATTISGITGGGTWSLAHRQAHATLGETVEIWAAPNASGGATTVTATTGSSVAVKLWVMEFSGCATSSLEDGTSAGADTNGTSHATGSYTPAAAGHLVIAAWRSDTNMTVSSGPTNFTESSSSSDLRSRAYYYVVPNTNALNPTLVTSGTEDLSGAVAGFNKAP